MIFPTPRSASSTAVLTMSTMESTAPTSWKWTSSMGRPWALDSASATISNIRRARAFTSSPSSMRSMISQMSRRLR